MSTAIRPLQRLAYGNLAAGRPEPDTSLAGRSATRKLSTRPHIQVVRLPNRKRLRYWDRVRCRPPPAVVRMISAERTSWARGAPPPRQEGWPIL